MSLLTKTVRLSVLLQILLEVTSVTIQMKDVKVKNCGKPVLVFNKIFDGDTSFTSYEEFTGDCNENILELRLDEPNSVHYVIVYEGQGVDEGYWDFFEVKLLRNGEVIMCGVFYATALKDGKGMRVNCESNPWLFSGVIINPRKKKKFNISEIEVHTVGRTTPGKHFMSYRGCFRIFGEKDIMMDKNCESICADKAGNRFAGIKANKTCACASSLNGLDEISIDKCSTNCPDGYTVCGTYESYAVYLVTSPLPYAFYCAKDGTRFSEDQISSKQMTVPMCLNHCDKSDKKYAVLKSGYICTCSRNILKNSGSEQTEAHLCNMKCFGNQNTYCGSSDQAFLLSTCKSNMSDKITCNDYINCHNYDVYGHCDDDCIPGFIGEHCLERDINWNPGKQFWRLVGSILAVIILTLLLVAVVQFLKNSHKSSSVSTELGKEPSDTAKPKATKAKANPS